MGWVPSATLRSSCDDVRSDPCAPQSLEMRDAHRPQMRLDVWEFTELLVRLAAAKHGHESCVDEMMATVMLHYSSESRDEAGLELGRSETQAVLAAWHSKLLQTFKFFAGDMKVIRVRANASSLHQGTYRAERSPCAGCACSCWPHPP